MTSSLHKDLSGTEVHVAYRWSYADQTEREAATGFVTGDVHSLALQEDNHSLWMLTVASPATWVRVSSTGGAYDSHAIHDNEGSEISAITEKTPPVAADLLLIEDSAASNAKKKLQIGSISHTLLADKGTNSHSTIDSHIGSTSNPHSVTKAQVGLTNVTDDAQLKRAAADFATFTEKTTPIAADLLLIEDSAASGAKKKVQASNLGAAITPTFGSQFNQAESLAESTITGTLNYSEKLKLTVNGLPAGKYRIAWSYTWAYNSASTNFKARVQVDDTTTLLEQVEEPSDAMTTQNRPSGGFAYVDLTAGNHTVDLDFATGNVGNTAYIRNARLELWRVN